MLICFINMVYFAYLAGGNKNLSNIFLAHDT
jgi:cbb3-type cytochrome oxidase subunit 3